MKAKVKATGEIVEVKSKVITSPVTGKSLLKYVNQKTGISYFEDELFFSKDLSDDPDYWTRLEHQYAGMAMQAYIIASHISQFSFCEGDMKDCKSMAYALVEKLKEKVGK